MAFSLFSGGAPEYLVAGLGNPGKQYLHTRHNAGFLAVEYLSQQLHAPVKRIRHHALTGNAVVGGHRVMLLMPQTYMNLSGESVGDAARFYKIPPERVLVISDDVALAAGRLRIRAKGSAGGHNGIKSIIGGLNSQSFPRVKIGVGAKPHPDYDLADWVLSNFTGPEDKLITEAAARAADAALEIIARGVPAAANDYNGAGPQ